MLALKSLSGKRLRPSKKKRPQSAENTICKNVNAFKRSAKKSLKKGELIVRKSRLNATLIGLRSRLKRRRESDKSKKSVRHVC